MTNNLYLKLGKLKSLSICVCLVALFSTTIYAQNVTTPRASQAAEVSQTIGLSKITINYSRPSVRGRKIWGGIVPYGFQKINFGGRGEIPWRAGANENTLFTNSHELKINGKTLPAGKHGLHLAIKEDGNVTVIFSKNNRAWGSYFYKQSEDVLRAEGKMTDSPMHVEQLMYLFEDVKRNTATVSLYWGKKKISFPIELDVKNITLASIKRQMTNLQGFNWQGALSAARYCVQNNLEMDQALAWANQSISQQSNFQNNSLKAMILMRMGKKDDAVKMVDKVMPLGTVQQLHGFGRQLIGAKMPKKALEVFEYNYKKHKNTWPVNVGLMRGYSANGNFKKALKHANAALKNVPKGDTINTPALKAAIKKLEKKQDIN